jgi:uncharacterized protein (DUF4415 family)
MKNRSRKITEELEALSRMRDEDVDTSDIPETLDWTGAIVGKFYRPVKEALSLRLDADILAWLKSQGPGYQTRINELLRNAMAARVSTIGTIRGGDATCRSSGLAKVPEGRCRTFRYPSLEKHGELKKYDRIAVSIEKRRTLFVPVQ